MISSIFSEITRAIKELHKEGVLISSVAEEGPYEKNEKVFSQTIIRVIYGTTFFDSITREKVEGPSFNAGVKDGSIVLKLYHIDDFIRFISEGDIAFYNFLYNNPEKQSKIISQYDYCISPFNLFKTNKNIFISQSLIENTINQACSFLEDALYLISKETKKDTINANILLSQGMYDILRVMEMEFDGINKWNIEYPYKNEKTLKIISAIANGYVPWSELLNIYRNKMNDLEKKFKNNINMPINIDIKSIEKVVNTFYIEYLSKKLF